MAPTDWELLLRLVKSNPLNSIQDGHNFWTKAGVPIFAPEYFFEGLRNENGQRFEPLDGELWMGRNNFQEVSERSERALRKTRILKMRLVSLGAADSPRPPSGHARTLAQSSAESLRCAGGHTRNGKLGGSAQRC